MPAPRTGKPRRTRFPAAVDLPLSSFHSPTTGKKKRYHRIFTFRDTVCFPFHGGGGESRTPVRENSTQSLYRFRPTLNLVPGVCHRSGAPEPAFRKFSQEVPVGINSCQPDNRGQIRIIRRHPV